MSYTIRRYSRDEGEIPNREVNEMLQAVVIEPANGPWSSPVGRVKKKDGYIRFCVNYTALNKLTVKDVDSLPRAL